MAKESKTLSLLFRKVCWKEQDLSKKVHISEAEIAEENNKTMSFG